MANAPFTTKVVILARGLGTRMRRADPEAKVLPEQSIAADTGVKAMMPIGRPFLDYVLTSLADAEFTEACLVIGPEHVRVRDYYEREVRPSRIAISFAVQERALGTANAVLAAEQFAANDSFAVLNSDNYYPSDALNALHALSEAAIVGFDRKSLVEAGNVPSERTARFGALDIGPDGYVRRILSSPTEEMKLSGAPIYSSMNCFLFTKEIFRPCREVPLSSRGEYELPQAIHFGMDKYGMRFRAVRIGSPVLDLSTRADIAKVASHLKQRVVNL